LSCPAIFFCRILYSRLYLSASWKKKSDISSPLLVRLPNVRDLKPWDRFSYIWQYIQIGKPYLHTVKSVRLWVVCSTDSKDSLWMTKGEKRKQDLQRIGPRYHIHLSPQANILSWTVDNATWFTRWEIGEWPWKFEPYNWQHLEWH